MDRRMSGKLYVTVVQAQLLFGLDTWVVTPRMARNLGGFHDRVVQRITGKLPDQCVDGSWE